MFPEITFLADQLELISNNHQAYSHPNDAARLYQAFQDLGTTVGKRMSELQQNERRKNAKTVIKS